MNQYVTGATIKSLREKRALTQSELASQLNVSDKAVSRWETGKGYPDITLLEPLARARFMISGVSDIYLFCNKDGLFRTHIPMTKRAALNR